MPRKKDNKKRWINLINWDRFYAKLDPFEIKDNSEELEKNDHIIKLIDKDTNNLIDLGCGEGVMTSTYKPKVSNLYACDVSEIAISRAKKSYGQIVEFFAWDITKSFNKKLLGKFDTVICNEVLYYIEFIRAII